MSKDQSGSRMDRWRGRVAVVTGASSGIGRAVALDLLKTGMHVAVCSRRLDLIENMGVEAGAPDAFMAKAADLRMESEIAGFFDAVKDHWQGVHVLVNNAGLGFEGNLATQDPDEWRQMLDVNVLALGICTQQALSQMGDHGEEGQIINIGSMSGHRVPAGSNGMYCATKFAVRALTETFRQELHAKNRPVRICEISPGLVETGFAAHYGGSEDAAEKTYGAFKCLQSGDIVDAVRYVLGQPTHVQVHDVLIRPKGQAS